MIDFGYVNYNSLEDDHPELVPMVLPDYVDNEAWEDMIHDMPQIYLEVMVCLFLGLSPQETAEALHYPNIARFYNINARMRSFYRKQKPRLLAYN